MREGRREPMVESTQVHRAGLLVIAMTIHNFPEGAAVGTAFAAGGTELGLPIPVAIATQNLPEGFAVAAPLLAVGASRSTAVLLAFASGAVEPIAAFGAFGACVDARAHGPTPQRRRRSPASLALARAAL